MSENGKEALDIVRMGHEAESRIAGYVRETPLDRTEILSEAGKCNVFLKQENLQITGSFKIRGAANHILSLSPEEAGRGVVTASTGNHGCACAQVFKQAGIAGTIYLPANASGVKLEALKTYGVDMVFHGNDCVEAENLARATAGENGQVYIPPYNHPMIVAGQATIGIELTRQLKQIDAVFVPVGGGGLMSGIAGYLKETHPAIEIIGCQPVNSPVMYESIKAGKIVDMPSLPTLSDGTAGGIEERSITFDLCRKYVDEFICVTEDEIRSALLLLVNQHDIVVEGAAALSVAAYAKMGNRFSGKNVVLVLSGDKLSPEH